MHKLLKLILITSCILCSEQKKSYSLGTLIGLTFAKMALDTNDDIKEHCPLDFGYLIAPVVGAAGPPQEAQACFANTVAIAILAFAAYEAVYYTVYTATVAALVAAHPPVVVPTLLETAAGVAAGELAGIAAAMAATMAYMASIYEVSSTTSEKFEICYDESLSSADQKSPLPYTDKEISNIIKQNNGTVDRSAIIDRYQKICIRSIDGSTVKWLNKNECTWQSGVMLCAYAYKGDPSVLCVRTSSTCPCRHPIDNGSDKQPEIAANADNIQYDENGVIKLNNVDVNFLKHCKIVKNGDTWGDDSLSNTSLLDPACFDMKGSSKNSGNFSMVSPVAECVIGTFRNLFEKKIKSAANFVAISADDAIALNKFDDDKVILLNIIDKISPFTAINKTTANSLNFNLSYTALKSTINALQSGNISSDPITKNLTQYEFYSETLKNLPSNSPLIITPTAPSNNLVDFQNGAIVVNNAITDAISIIDAQRNLIKSGNAQSPYLSTLYGNFQSTVKSLIMISIVLYVLIFGLKLLMGDVEIKGKEIINQFITIGLVSYFAIGDGWKDYGLNILLRASQGIADLVIDIIGVNSNDKCSINGKYFAIDPANANYNIINNVDAKNYIINKTVGSLTTTQRNTIDTFCSTLAGGNDRIFILNNPNGSQDFYCPRGEYMPRPNYSHPYVPSLMAESTKIAFKTNSGYSWYDRSYMPVRCVDDDNNLLYCQQNDVDCTGTGISTALTSIPYYAKMVNLNGNNILICQALLSGNKRAFVASGYHVEDLKDMGYLTQDVANGLLLLPSQILPTGFFAVTWSGSIVTPLEFYSSSDAFYGRINRAMVAQKVDSIRSSDNILYKKYPIIKTDGGSNRDLGYLAAFDVLDCKIGKYLMAQSNGLPKVILMALQLAFTSLMGFICAVTVVVYASMMFIVLIKVAQNYIVGMTALIFMMYISPITIPCSLFSFTKGVFDKWKGILESYVVYPPASFILIPFIMKISDMVMYGHGDSYDATKLFNSDGSISDKCFDGNTKNLDDIKDAPYMCLLQTLSSKYSWTPIVMASIIFLPIIPIAAILATMLIMQAVISGSEHYLMQVLFYKSISALITMAITLELIDKFEETLKDILGGGDMGIKGGIDKISSNISIGGIAQGGASAIAGVVSAGRNAVGGSAAKLETKRNELKAGEGSDMKTGLKEDEEEDKDKI